MTIRIILAIIAACTLTGENIIPADALKKDGMFTGWSCKPEYISDGYNGTPSIRVDLPDPNSTAGIISVKIPVTEGVKYDCTVKARGKGTLNAQFYQYGDDTKPLVRDVPSIGALTGEWTEYSKAIQVSNSVSTLTVNFLFYKSTGSFEIADLKITPVPVKEKPARSAVRRTGKDGPSGWWVFDTGDRSGLTTYDRAGNAHGDLSDGASFSAGRSKGGVTFDGKGGSVICDEAPALGQTFTIAAWFKTEDLKAVRWHSIYAGDLKGCHYLRINEDGKLMLLRADIAMTAVSKGAVSSGTWHHAAVTYAQGAYAFYIDGSDAGSGTVDHQPFVEAEHASLGIVAAGGPPRPMKGELDDVRVYDRALSAAEIRSIAGESELPPDSAASIASRRAPTITMQLSAAAPDNWFSTGEPVVFRIDGDIVDTITALEGNVSDARGKPLGSVILDRREFSKGWSWKAPYTGYFEIQFFMQTKSGKVPLIWKYRNQTSRGTSVSFTRDRQAVAVMPPMTKKKRPQFGVSYGNGGEEELRKAALLGLSFVRWHCIPWGAKFVDESVAVEPARGTYRWDVTDPHVALFKKYGFAPNEIIGNVVFTPKWASPYPDDSKIDIAVIGRTAYAPAKLEYFSDFLKALVSRYGKDISVWELWNEPHIKGSSIFWKDTTENFAKMMRAGYEAVKEVQPESEIWIGGMGGTRYLPFYKELLTVGGAPFDRIPMHGSWQKIEGFRKLEKEFGMPSKPWVSSEWHAVLISAMQKPPSEASLARRLILDLSEQLMTGVERTALFHMSEGNSEKELLPAAYADGSFQQSFGMFRARPNTEPRLAAIAMRVFIDHVDERLDFGGHAELSAGQYLVWFKNGASTLTILWNEGATALPDSRIRSALASTRITTAEGYPADAGLTLEPERVYFVKGLPAALLTTLPAATVPLNPDLRKPKEIKNVPTGMYSTASLLSDDLEITGDAVWNTADIRYIKLLADKPTAFKARFAVSFGAHGLDIIIDVKDSVFVQKGTFPSVWGGDSVQFALDTDGNGFPDAQTEFAAALLPSGPVIFKTKAASVGGDLPQRWSAANKPLAFGKAAIDRTDGATRYRIHIDKTELYPFNYEPNAEIRFSVLINNNDGAGRAGYLEWSSGIGASKDASEYGKLTASK